MGRPPFFPPFFQAPPPSPSRGPPPRNGRAEGPLRTPGRSLFCARPGALKTSRGRLPPNAALETSRNCARRPPFSRAPRPPPHRTDRGEVRAWSGSSAAGGMGTVWEGRHTTLGNTRRHQVHRRRVRRQRRGADALRQRVPARSTSSPSTPSRSFDQGGVTQDGKPYIVMELLLRGSRSTIASLIGLGRIPLADGAHPPAGCACAHPGPRAGDRPSRSRSRIPIFLVRGLDDDDEIAKVVDFGIAKFKKVDGENEAAACRRSSTKDRGGTGTPFYMAPQQACSAAPSEDRSPVVDLWSMGVIVFKCVAARCRSRGSRSEISSWKICTTPAPTLRR